MPRSTDELHNEIERERQRVNQRLDELHNRVDTIARSQDRIMGVMEGDKTLFRKGFIEQMLELLAFMDSYKDFDLKAMKDMMALITNIKKSLLWLGAFLMGLATILGVVIKLFDNIKQWFH